MVIAQKPNASIITAAIAAVAAHFAHGLAHGFASAVFYIALSIWAYEEIVHGLNWFRRLLGAAVGIYILVTLTLALVN
jgi:hypothetical protein